MKYSKTRYQIWFSHLRACLFTTVLSLLALYVPAFAEEPSSNLESVQSQPRALQEIEILASDSIPESSPYVFGYEPRWDEGHSEIHGTNDTIDLLHSMWTLAEQRAQEQSTQWTEEEKATWEMLRRLPVPRTAEELKSMGFDRPSAAWVYGLGLTPSAVIELPSPERFLQWVEKNISPLSHGFDKVQHPLGAYWRKGLKRWTLLVRLKLNKIYISIIPRESEPVLLSYFLRDQQAKSVTKKLESLFKQLPMGARGSGFISLKNLIDLFFGSEQPLLKFSASGFGLPSPFFSGCESDLRSIGEAMHTMSFGLSRSAEGHLEVLTQLSLSEEHLNPLLETTVRQSVLEPLKIKSNLDQERVGEIASRTQFKAFFDVIDRLGGEWRSSPWTCPILVSLNQFSGLQEKAQYQIAKGILSSLSGFTARVKEQRSGDQPEEIKPFSVWLEIAHQSPQQLLRLISSMSGSDPLEASDYQSDSKVKHLRLSNPKLAKTHFSLDAQRLMLSIDDWGLAIHTGLRESSLHTRGMISEAHELSYPILWLSLPPSFSEWLNERLSLLKKEKKQGDAKQKTLGESSSSIRQKDSVFRYFSLHILKSGLLLRVGLDVKTL